MFGLLWKMFMRSLISIVNASNHKKYISLRFNLLLLVYILTNTAKNYTIIHWQSNKIDAQEVVILSMTYLKI